MVTVVYRNGIISYFLGSSREQIEATADELAHQMGTQVGAVWMYGGRH